ncbi:phage tail tape measure protein [Streptomyces sp. NPDC055722]
MASTSIVYAVIARDSASRTFHQIGRAAGSTDSMLAKLGKTAKIAGEALAVGLAVGLAESAKQAAEFQSSMTKISTQAGGTAKDVRQLSDAVLKLGATTQQGPKELADSLYHLKSVGLDNANAMKALKEASDLAAVGGSSLEETTNALAGAWRTGIKGAGSFHEAVSTVNAIIGAGNMRMEQFTEAIGTGILPSAKTFGLSLKQVGAALALMTDEGIPAVDAATRLRMSFSLLGAPSGAAEKQLKKIGLTGLDLAKAMRSKDGLIGAVQLLKDHLEKSGLSTERQSQLLSRAFGGGRSSSAILTLVNNLDVLKKKQDQVNKTTGRFNDAVKMQRKTAEAQWKLLVSNLEVMSVRVGTKVLPPLTSFVKFLSTTAMPAAGRFGRAMGRLIPVDKIKQGFQDTQKLVSDFFAGLSGNKGGGLPLPLDLGKSSFSKGLPPSVIAHGLGAQTPTAPKVSLPKNIPPSVAAHGLIPQNILPKPSQAKMFGQQIRDAISGGIENIDWSKTGAAIGRGLGSAVQWLVKNGAKLVKQLGEAIGGLDWVDVGKQLGKVALPTAIGFMNNLFEPLFHVDFWKKHWLDVILFVVSAVPIGKVAGKLGGLLGKVPWGKAFEVIGKAFERIPWSKMIPFGKKLSESLGPIIRGIGSWVARVARGFGKAFAEKFPKIAQWFDEQLYVLPDRLGDLGRLLKRKGGELISKLGKGLIEHVPGMGKGFIRLVLKTFGRFSLYQTGLNLAKSFISGAWEKIKDIGHWMKKKLVDPVVHWVKSGFGIASPSKVFTGIGGNLVAGLKSGVLGAVAGIGKWMWSHVGSPAVGAFKHAGSWLKDKGSALISGMKSGIVDKMSKIGDWVKSNIVDPVVGAVKHFFGIKSPSRVFMSIGGHLVSGLMKGMSRTSGTAIAKKVFGSLPKALAAIAKKGLVSISALPGKALKALGGLGGDILGLLGLGGSGGGSGANQKLGQVLAAARGWSGPQWAALKSLWTGESGWNERALNKSSGAYGIAQALPASKYASAGGDWKTNAGTQIKWGLSYIASRYGNPLNAYSAWLSRSPHWYAKGTDGAAKGLAWVGERGPELVNFKGGETVWSHSDSMSLAQAHGIALPGYAKGTKSAKNATEVKAIANQLANGFLKQLATGTASAIASVLKSLTSKLLNAGYNKLAKSVLKAGDKLEALANKRASVQQQIAAANQYAADQSSNIRDFLSISGTSAVDVGTLIAQMSSQQKTASSFVALSRTLKSRGAGKDLLQALSDAGPGSQLATILGNASMADISKLNSLMKSGGTLATSFGRDMADLMYDSGKDASRGFLAGLKSQEKALEKQMSKLASDLVKAIKKALKIKSPSQVMRDEVGKNVVLGWVAGMDAHGHLVGASAQRLADTATGVSVRRRYVPTAARSSAGGDDVWERLAAALEQQASQPQQLTGQLVLDSGELLGVIQGTVKPMVKASEQRQAHRAKVGRR